MSPSTLTKIDSELTETRFVSSCSLLVAAADLSLRQADEAYLVGKGLTPVAAYLAQDDIIKVRSFRISDPIFANAYARSPWNTVSR